jgi:hypothetical protein
MSADPLKIPTTRRCDLVNSYDWRSEGHQATIPSR